MATDVPFGRKIRFHYIFRDAQGAPAKVDGTPNVTATLGTVVETVVEGDGWSTLVDPGAPGTGSASGDADVDLGSGVKPLGFILGDYTALESPEATNVEVGQPNIE